jgi:hypothetical protein
MAASRRLVATFGWLGLVVLGARGLAGQAPAIELHLTPESSFTSGCFPPCLCPIQIVEGMGGTLTFRLADSDPLFTNYDVAAAFTVPGEPPRSLQGSGRYRVGGEVLIVQELDLDLSTNGGPVESFHSGPVPGAGDFPAGLEITVSIGTRECFDTVLDIRARAKPGGFVRGECNADGSLDISDPVSSLFFLFGGGAEPSCLDACDANDDGSVNISDAVWTLNHLFLGGDSPPPPAGACGEDPTADGLACGAYAPCAADCEEEIAAIASDTQIVGSCGAVVRLDYLSRRILGWQLLCGKYSQVTEESAREQAKTDTGFGEGRMLNPAQPEDAYVFYQAPGDFGGAGVVSARTGLSLFGGGIVWDGAGDITHPKEWRSAATLGGDCERFPGDIPARGYDLVAGGAEVAAADIEATLEVVRRTALLEGMATSGYVFDAVVILYPRSVGAFNPLTAEWIVIVNGGWLE